MVFPLNDCFQVYYHCSKRRKGIKCTQKSVRLDGLEKQIDALLSNIEIPESFTIWAIEHLNGLHDQEAKDQKVIYGSIDNAYKDYLERINNLIKLKISPMNTDGLVLSDEDFKVQMTDLQKERKQLEEQQQDLGKRVDEWVELSQKTFKFACFARYHFQHGTLQEKKEILATIGSNFILRDKLLRLDVPKPFKVMEKAKIEVEKIPARFEPEEKSDLMPQIAYLFNQSSILRREWDLNPRYPFGYSCSPSNRTRPLCDPSGLSLLYQLSLFCYPDKSCVTPQCLVLELPLHCTGA